MQDSVPLVGHKCSIYLEFPNLEISYPRYFGHRKLGIPASRVALASLAQLDAEQADPKLTESTRVALLTAPSLRRRGRSVPNLMLLFEDPVELPRGRLARLRLSGLVIHRRHPQLDRRVDGLFVKAQAPEDAVGMLVRAGATPTRTPVAWLRAHRQDRLSWPLAPLLAPSEYLRKMGRNWLAGVVVAIPSLVVFFAPVGYFKFLGLAGLAGVIASRFRWDRFERDYKQAMQRQQAPPKRNRELLSEALRHLRS